MIWRALTADDAEAVRLILVGAERLEPAGLPWSLEEVAEELALPSVDLQAGSVAAVRDGSVVGAGWLNVAAPAQTWLATHSGGVTVDALGQGIGRQLLRRLSARAELLRARQAPELPGELRWWIPEQRGRAVRLADAAGYRTIRWFQDMRYDLAELPDRPPPGGDLRVTAWSESLDASLRECSNEAFADHFGSRPLDPERWRAGFADAAAFRPAVSRLAVDRSGVVSFVLVEEYDSETVANGFRTAYLARVGTARRARGGGIATHLIAEALKAAAADGFTRAELTVDSESPTGAGRLYQSLGFRGTHRSMLRSSPF